MRAEQATNKWAGTDVSYTSDIWDQYVVASEVFINPTVNTGQGTRQLIGIVSEGISDFITQHRELYHERNRASRDREYIYYQSLLTRGEQRKEGRANFDEKERKRGLLKKVGPYELQKVRYDNACTLVEDMVGKFEQLGKITTKLLDTQEELGSGITKTATGIMGLTVSIKCIDTIWQDILSLHAKILKLKDDIVVAKLALAPIEGRMKLLTIPGGEDDEGNRLEPQHLWVYDSQDKNPGNTLSLERINELAENAPADDEATTPSSNDSTLVEEFEDKCQVGTAPEGARMPNFTIVPGSLRRKAMEEPAGSKRKAGEDSPVREADANAENEGEETDGELTFICE